MALDDLGDGGGAEGGGAELALPLEALARELGLAHGDHPDAVFLRRAAEALAFVDELPLGAPLPSEVVTGAPSWAVPPRHRSVAGVRLRARIAHLGLAASAGGLVGAAGGGAPPTPAELERLAEALGTGRRDVLDAAAEGELAALDAIGTARVGLREVTGRVEALAGGLAYVLCLGERAEAATAVVRSAAERAEDALRYEADARWAARGLREVALAARERLAAAAWAAEVAAVGDVLAALREPEGPLDRLAEARNALQRDVRRWEASAAAWRAPGRAPAADEATKRLLLATYRRLARHDLPATAWPEVERRTTAAPSGAGRAGGAGVAVAPVGGPADYGPNAMHWGRR